MSDTPRPPGPPDGQGRDRGTEDGAESLTRVTLRGFAWTLTGTAGQAVMQLVSTIVLARLLVPEEFGTAAAAMLVIGLAQVVTQMGVGPALVQRRKLTDDEIGAATIFSVLLSAVLALVLYVLTPLFNVLVGLPAESELLRLASIVLLLAGLAAVPLGLLQRHLRFRAMSVVEVAAYGPAMLGVSIFLAASGFGAGAVVAGQIASQAVQTIGFYALARPPFRLAAPAAMWRRLRPLLRFGSGYSLSQLGNWMALNADTFVVANALGPGPLGIYTRAYSLLAQPANIIGTAIDKVLFPAMSRVRDDGERLKRAYVQAASVVAIVTVPASALLFVLAPELILILLGPDWVAVALPLQIFALVLLPRTSYKISGSLTRATGAVFRGAWRQWLYAIEVAVGCAIGAQWGVDGVAVGASVAIVLHFLVMLHFSGRVAEGLTGSVLRMYIKHIPVAAAAFGATYGAALLLRPLDSAVLTVLAAAPAGLIATALTIAVTRRAFRNELDAIGSVLRRRAAPASPPAGAVRE